MQYDKKQAQQILSANGIFGPWYLRTSQLDVYDLLLDCHDPFIEASRRWGKTTSIAIFVHELLLANPGWICRWCAPDQKQARTIVKPIFSHIQKQTPDGKKARWKTTDSHYQYPNGSILYLVGVNHDRGESARGPAANIIVLDEYGFWVDPDYIAKSILYPQLQNQEGQWFIKASTPPPDLGHAYYAEKEIAIRKGRFIQKKIWDNEALSKAELDKIIEEAGGVDSITFRREYLCEEVADPKSLVIPEWSDENIVADDYARPEWPTYYVAGDSGADDNTALLFAYYDFIKNELVIEDEYVRNGETTRTITDFAKAKELELWGTAQPRARVYDAPKQLIYDLYGEYNYPVAVPPKDDKIAAIHSLRVEVGARRIKVKAKCVNTIRQMKVGMWRDEKHSDFQRYSDDSGLGHLDALASMVYLNRIIDRGHNPIPASFGASPYTHLINTPKGQPSDETESALVEAFGFKRR